MACDAGHSLKFNAASGDVECYDPTSGAFYTEGSGAAVRQRNYEFLGILPDGTEVYQNLDAQSGAVGIYVNTPNGLKPATAQQRQALIAEDAPAPSRGPQPDQYIDPRTGELVGIDPYTGREVYRQPGADFPQEDPNVTRFHEADQRFREQQQQNAYQSAESGKSREQNARESALDRAQRQTEFQAQQAQAQRAEARQGQQDEFDRELAIRASRERNMSQQLDAANQFAGLVSTTDPGALPAFLEAGGGNISNAIASGGTALSNNALMPAARTLRTIDQLRAPQLQYPGQQPVQEIDPASEAAWRQRVLSTPQAIAYENLQNNPGGNYEGFGGVYSQGGPTGFSSRSGSRIDEQGNVVPLATQQIDPTDIKRARAGQLPYVEAAQGFDGTVTRPTVFMAGENGPENVQVDPLDQPYMERVRALRTRTPYPQLNPYSVGFRLQSPTVQQTYYGGQQLRYGIPIQDTMAQEQQYRLQGRSRGGVRVIG